MIEEIERLKLVLEKAGIGYLIKKLSDDVVEVLDRSFEIENNAMRIYLSELCSISFSLNWPSGFLEHYSGDTLHLRQNGFALVKGVTNPDWDPRKSLYQISKVTRYRST